MHSHKLRIPKLKIFFKSRVIVERANGALLAQIQRSVPEFDFKNLNRL